MAMSAASLLLAACTENDTILPGKREDIRSVLQDQPAEAAAPAENEARNINLPAAQANASWPQAYGSPSLRTDHAALGTQLTRIWTAKIGAGDARKQRITAAPVVAGGVVYTLDSEALVTATSTSGQQVWQKDLRPDRDGRGQATGGGVAFHEGRLYVSLGYGVLVALDAVSGAELWRQQLNGTASGMPTVFDGLVYLLSLIHISEPTRRH